MGSGIVVRILGDYGPFSRMGKSIGYQIEIGSSSYLIDCGAPLFQQIGGHGLKKFKGLIITHCHDDHKRWFSDLALFSMYAPDVSDKITLITAEEIHDDLMRASMPALEKSLSKDSKHIIDIAYDDYVAPRIIGPRPKFRIVMLDRGNGETRLCITDRKGSVIGPEHAKIVISRKTKTPRMLFRDPEYREWVEPESFYSFSSEIFYEKDRNIFRDPEGFTLEAIKAPVWHGVPGIGIKVKMGRETLVFSSDTAHHTGLWKQLCGEKKKQSLTMSKQEFASASVLYGDINDYIERIWSRERYEDALRAFRSAAVIHDISVRNSVVHTDYERLKNTTLNKERVILTHSPDRITSEWMLCNAGKTFHVRGNKFFEAVGDRLYPMDADVYHKESGRYFVGYRNARGKYAVHEKEGLLRFSSGNGTHPGRVRYRVDLYEDISGGYYPRIEDTKAEYFERSDGQVERIEFGDNGSTGTVVKSYRGLIKRGSRRR